MVEAILTCNWILGFEFYGMSHKKRGFVTFGIGFRIYCVVVQVLLLIGSIALLSHFTSSEVRFLGLVFLHGAGCPCPVGWNDFFIICSYDEACLVLRERPAFLAFEGY